MGPAQHTVVREAEILCISWGSYCCVERAEVDGFSIPQASTNAISEYGHAFLHCYRSGLEQLLLS